MKGLTKRQREIIDYIKEFTHTHRYSPSYREIMKHFGFSCVGSVAKHIQALKRKGALTNEKSCSRSLALIQDKAPLANHASPASPFSEVPLIGCVHAGGPIELYTHTEAIAVPEALIHNRDATYALRVQGESLEEDMIIDGDLLVIEARQKAFPGETVIALVNHTDIIVKQYYLEGLYVKLIGHNSHHHPIIIREEDVSIQAVLVGLLRTFPYGS